MFTSRPSAACLAAATLALLIAGCSAHVKDEAGPPFCYRWLLDVLCYDEPFPNSEARRLGAPKRHPAG